MAQAKQNNTTKRSRLPSRQTPAQLYKLHDSRMALRRMEHIVATLESCVVTEGWNESGPMPKLAADVVSYLRARAGGARENATEGSQG